MRSSNDFPFYQQDEEEGGGGPQPLDSIIQKLQDAAAEPDVVLTLGTSNEWPFLRDYAGTLSDDDLGDMKGTARGERDAVFQDVVRDADQTSTHAELQTVGAMTIVIWVKKQPGATFPWGTESSISVGSSGESEAANFAYVVRHEGNGYNFGLYRETGSGGDREVNYIVPDGSPGDDYTAMSFRVDASGNGQCYMGQHQLGWGFGFVGGVTTDLDGNFTGLVASGGTLGVLGANALTGSLISGYIQTDSYASEPPSEALRGGFDFQIPAALRSEGEVAAMAAESGCVMAFTGGSPTSGNAPVDLLGNIDAAGGFAENALGTIPEDRCFRYIGDRYITGIVGSTYAPPAASFPDPIILGDLRVRCGFVYRTGSTFIVGNFATGESANTDYPWSANMNGGNRIRWFSETLGGRNIDIQWTLPETLNGGDAREFEMIKSDNGDGTSDLSVKWYWPGSPDGEILNTVASISVQSPATAVDNGSYVTITNTTDASLTQFGLSANAPVRYCVIYDTVP